MAIMFVLDVEVELAREFALQVTYVLISNKKCRGPRLRQSQIANLVDQQQRIMMTTTGTIPSASALLSPTIKLSRLLALPPLRTHAVPSGRDNNRKRGHGGSIEEESEEYRFARKRRNSRTATDSTVRTVLSTVTLLSSNYGSVRTYVPSRILDPIMRSGCAVLFHNCVY